MAYNILLDTSIFVNQCFCFENKYLKGLSRLKQAGLINLFITDVIKSEVENRISISIKNGAKVIKKDAHILGAYLDIDPKKIINDITTKFHEFLFLNTTTLDVPEYYIGKRIINKYMNNEPPFDNAKENKKQEFPDAFIIETFADHLEMYDSKGIFLSNDKDCITFIKNNDRLEYMDNIGALLDRLNRENEAFTSKITQAMNDEKSNLISTLNDFIEKLDLENYDYSTDELSHNSLLDYTIETIDYEPNSIILNRSEYEILDIDPEENYVQILIPIRYQVNSILDAKDYTNAIYDREDDRYYFVENVEI